MLKKFENNGAEEIGLVTHTPEFGYHCAYKLLSN